MHQSGYKLWISRQVIREYLVQVTRPGFLAVPLTAPELETYVQKFRAVFNIADETEAVTNRLLELIKQYPSGGIQIHDANIVATMLVYNIGTLLTINVEDLKRFSPLIRIVSPSPQP